MTGNDDISLHDLKTKLQFDFLSQVHDQNDNNFFSANYNNNIIDDSPYSQINFKCDYFDENEFIDTYKNLGKFSFLSWNIQSLPAKFFEVKEFLEFNTESGCVFDVIALQELWTIHDPDMFKINGYNLVFKSRSEGVQGGGVGFYVRSDLKFKVLREFSVFIDKVIETVFLEIELNKKNSIIVSSIYRPNSKHPTLTSTQQLQQFIEIFSEILSNVSSLNKKAYLMGDFNIDILKFQYHEKTADFIENCFSNGFLQLITKPTRAINGSATLIDHFFTNECDNCLECGIITSRISDHFPIFAIISQEKTNANPEYIYIRSMSDEAINNFKTALNSQSWEGVYAEENANDGFNNFLKVFEDLFEIYFPVKKTKFNKNVHKKEPFISSGLMVSRRKKLELSAISIKTPTPLNKEKFKNYKNMYNKVIREAKKLYYAQALKENKSNLKKTWEILREALRKLNDKSSIVQLNIDDNIIEDQAVIADEFNKYFTDIAEKIAEEINPTDRPPDDFLREQNSEFRMVPAGPQKIIEIVNKLESKTSKDQYNLSNVLIKKIISSICEPLSHIISKSIETGLVPNKLKIAKVVPIFKLKKSVPEDHLLIENYRPISLLPIFSKILEKVVAEQLTDYLEANNILYKHQYGYLRNNSTFHPMIHFLNKISEASNKGELTIGVFCDLQRAFDTCSHSIMAKKLEKAGIKGTELLWFKNYLANRQQFVSVNGKDSECRAIKKGVPQGSILGPYLFLVYINDLTSCTSLFAILFADDTSFLISGKNLNEIIKTLNIELQKVCEWFRANELSLHAGKTKFMIFTNNEEGINWESLNIQLNYNNIGSNDPELIKNLGYINSNSDVPAIKFLGVYFDPKLNFKYHIEQIRKK